MQKCVSVRVSVAKTFLVLIDRVLVELKKYFVIDIGNIVIKSSVGSN